MILRSTYVLCVHHTCGTPGTRNAPDHLTPVSRIDNGSRANFEKLPDILSNTCIWYNMFTKNEKTGKKYVATSYIYTQVCTSTRTQKGSRSKQADNVCDLRHTSCAICILSPLRVPFFLFYDTFHFLGSRVGCVLPGTSALIIRAKRVSN